MNVGKFLCLSVLQILLLFCIDICFAVQKTWLFHKESVLVDIYANGLVIC